MVTSNDIIAGNGRVLIAYMFIMWLYLLKKIFNVNIFFLLSFFVLIYHSAKFDVGCLQNLFIPTNFSWQGAAWHRQRAKKPTVFPNISVLGWNIFLAGNKYPDSYHLPCMEAEIVETTFIVSRFSDILNEKRLLSDAISGILKSFTLSLHGGIKFATQISLLLNYSNKKGVKRNNYFCLAEVEGRVEDK